MVQGGIDPRFNNVLDVAKIANETNFVQRLGGNIEFGDGIVPVEVTAFTGVLQETMAVTKLYTCRSVVSNRECCTIQLI